MNSPLEVARIPPKWIRDTRGETSFSRIKSIGMQMAINITHRPPNTHTHDTQGIAVSPRLCFPVSAPASFPRPVLRLVRLASLRFSIKDIEMSSCMGVTALSLSSGKNQINRHFEEFKMRPYITRWVEVYHASIAAPGADRQSSLQRSCK